MKKALITVILTIVSSIPFLYSQTVSSDEEYKAYFKQHVGVLNSCIASKDYECMKSSLEGWLAEYDKLSEVDKEKHKYGLNDLYYYLTSAYSGLGETEKAVKTFESLVNIDFKNYALLKNDSSLNNIRENTRFKELFEIVRERGDYIRILSKSGPYLKRPELTYENADSPALKRIREYFNLDSIAGNGDELSRIFNLMTWAHNTIEHNGGYWAEVNMSAIDIYEHAKKNNTGVNCRFQAVFLNECYLALGFKSRFVTCSPKEDYNQKAHVINTVYSQTLGKWIWIDATMNTYVVDDQGNYLSIPEVRERLIEGKAVEVSKDANWNNRVKYTKEDYIDSYMAELLYWFSCAVDNSCGTDNSLEENSSVVLLPVGFEKEKKKFEYFTHDEDYFWEK